MHFNVVVYCFCYSNIVFYTRTVLAALAIDHSHLNRRVSVSTDGNEQYHRIWCKEWDVVARKEKKEYEYIVELQVLLMTHVQ